MSEPGAVGHRIVAGGPSDVASAGRHVLVALIVAVVGLATLVVLNSRFAPEMYDRAGARRIAEALAANKTYAVFDLNLNIREIRDHHIKRFGKTPDVAILGASHWQEAHADIVPASNFYNAHIHRDYYEDMLAMTEIFERHDRMPKTLVISIRDNLFTPVAERRDFLWLPGIPYYRAMAPKLGLTPHSMFSTLPVQRWREQISVQMLFENVTRWYNADEHPHASDTRHFVGLDTLLPDGSIIWSREHRTIFTADRTRRMVAEHAQSLAQRPPKIDPKGVAAVDALLSHLTSRGVDVVLAHPPFNPDFYEMVRHAPYMAGLDRVKALTADFARKYNLRIIGSFDPSDLGCTADQYIDAEHANASCLAKVFAQLSPEGTPLPVPQGQYALSGDLDHQTWPKVPTLTVATNDAALASQKAAIEEAARHQPARQLAAPRPAVLADVVATGGSATRTLEIAPASGQRAAPIERAVRKVTRERTVVRAVPRRPRASNPVASRELIWPGDRPFPRRTTLQRSRHAAADAN